jgi:hypothetical protein
MLGAALAGKRDGCAAAVAGYHGSVLGHIGSPCVPWMIERERRRPMRRAVATLIMLVVLSCACQVAEPQRPKASGQVTVAVEVPAPATVVGDPFEAYAKAARLKEKYETGLLAGYDVGAGMADTSAFSDEQKERMARMHSKIKKFMLVELGWDVIEDEFMDMYRSTFTPDEMRQLVAVLRTPAGEMLVEREISLIPKAMVISQKHAKAIMPKIMEMAMREMQD